MTLTLRIENYERLENGEPAEMTLDRSGASIGRSRTMDWVLPDPARHISGHHFDIIYEEGQYWLSDVSTNGTFLQGDKARLMRPHLLAPGDRIVVGQYVIQVELRGSEPLSGPATGLQVPPAVQTWSGQMMGDESGIWRMNGEHAEPARPAVQSPPGSVVPQPPAAEPDPHPEPAPQPEPVPSQEADVFAVSQPGPAAAEVSDPMLRAFCDGAGLSLAAVQAVDAQRLAYDAGQFARVATELVMAMLQDRASIKQFTRAGERTMLGAKRNNPLKFMPDAESALDALLLNPRHGFMDGPEGIGAALGDLRQHQMAVFAALQPAIARLLDGLAPEEAQDWETYVSRWQEKSAEGEHGMLDAFLKAYADAYARATRAD